ncbi:MAG: CapA family protein [Anaerolineales bacterium]|nr:CapA family protein [Anaerolineales bacterium]
MKKQILTFVLLILLVACSAPTATPTLTPVLPTPTSAPTQPVNATATATQIPPKAQSLWIYALAAPFPTVPDDVSSADLLAAWNGESLSENGQPLLMAESTLRAFRALWGEPASGAVRSVDKEEILDEAWTPPFKWAIIPFEEIQPKWKILSVDGQSPIHKDFDENVYPLKALISGENLPATNRDPSKLATVVLTGVTALVRATAFTMETKGVTRPGELVYDWLHGADVLHVSNEVAFDSTCPFPKPGYTNYILCSDPKYLELLKYVGTDIVELTGDHFADRGSQAMLDTLQMYKDNNILYYGGGANEEEGRKPVYLNVNGNKIAFMGCNGKVAYTMVKATDIKPGAADCGDYKFFTQQVKDVAAQGYMVIFTFQHEECYHSGPCYMHAQGFHAVADAGATVVSGSQAHFPHLMEFRGDSFIHFGLGNLFFDQMTYELPDGKIIDGTRREFIDRHIFYDGKYLGVELLTAMLEDFSRPRPMNQRERTQFLSEYFAYSGWTTLQPTPLPPPTPTLTPIALPSP